MFIEICLTRNCNKSCYYCDITNKNYQENVLVDEDYLKWVLNLLNSNDFTIELTGGEIGIISNIMKIFKIVNDKKYTYIQCTSNGTLRYKYSDFFLEHVNGYLEHNIIDINNNIITKHFELDLLFHPKASNVIVLTPETVNSLLHNKNYIQLYNNKYVFLKPLVERKLTYNNDLINKTKMIFNIYNKTKYSDYYKHIFSKNLLFTNKEIQDCCNKPPFPVIDISTKRIYHCGYVSYKESICKSFEITSENIRKLKEQTLFSFNKPLSYCKNCKGIITKRTF